MSATFELNPAGCTQILQNNKQVAEALTTTARAIQSSATSRIPVHRNRRHFAASLGVSSPQMTETGQRVYVFSKSPYWHFIEYGSINNAPTRPLTGAAASIKNATFEAT